MKLQDNSSSLHVSSDIKNECHMSKTDLLFPPPNPVLLPVCSYMNIVTHQVSQSRIWDIIFNVSYKSIFLVLWSLSAVHFLNCVLQSISVDSELPSQRNNKTFLSFLPQTMSGAPTMLSHCTLCFSFTVYIDLCYTTLVQQIDSTMRQLSHRELTPAHITVLDQHSGCQCNSPPYIQRTKLPLLYFSTTPYHFSLDVTTPNLKVTTRLQSHDHAQLQGKLENVVSLSTWTKKTTCLGGKKSLPQQCLPQLLFYIYLQGYIIMSVSFTRV